MALLVSELVASVLAGEGTMDEVRWDDLVATVHRQMRTVAGPSPDLEDLTQVALEQVVRSMDRFRGEGELATFTYRICVNVALNHWKSFRRWWKRFTIEEVVEAPSSASDPSEMALELERARRLYACLDRVEPMRRVIVTLADLEELPASRIAEIVGCPEPTVRSRLRRARRELAELLERDPVFQQRAEDEPRPELEDAPGDAP